MDLHHLRVFQSAAQHTSFTVAGRELSLSQSTVSLHIKQLETEFGCMLFLRAGKRLSVTEAGQILLQHVGCIFAEIRTAELAVREYSTSQRGTIRLGVGATTLIYLLPKVLAAYRKKYSHIEILVTTGVTEALVDGLMSRTLDLAIVMNSPHTPPSVTMTPLMEEELVMVLSPQHPSAEKASLSTQDVAELAFISHLRGTAMQRLQQDYFEAMGIQPRIAMELENIEAIKSLVGAGMGAALLPLCSVTGAYGRGVVYKKVRGFPMTRRLSIAVSDWSAQPPAIRRLASRILRALGTPNSASSTGWAIEVTDDSH